MNYDVIIIGSGISGLITAYELQKSGKNVLVLEKEETPGGRMSNAFIDGHIIPRGAEFITSSYTTILSLCKELRIEIAHFDNEQFGFMHDHKLYVLNHRDILKLFKFGVISNDEKRKLIRALPKLAKRVYGTNSKQLEKIAENDTESINEYMTNVIGKEFVEKFVDPVVRTTFSYENGGNEMSANYALAWLGNSFGRQHLNLKKGIGELTRVLAEKVPVTFGVNISRVETIDENVVVHTNKQTFEASHVVFACNAGKALDMISDAKNFERDFLSSVQYSSFIRIVCRTKKDFIQKNSFEVIPLKENSHIEAISPLQRHEGYVDTTYQYFMVNLRFAAQEECKRIGLENHNLIAQKLHEYYDNFPEDMTVEYIQHWPQAIPVFKPGYVERLLKFRTEFLVHALETKRLFVGDYLGGPYLEGAAFSTEKIIEYLK